MVSIAISSLASSVSAMPSVGKTARAWANARTRERANFRALQDLLEGLAPWTLHFRSLSGETHVMHVHATRTVGQGSVGLIAEMFGQRVLCVDRGSVQLVLGEQLLNADRALSDYNIQNESFLSYMLRSPVGM